MATVVLDRVTRIYHGNVVAVEDFSLKVTDRELVVIVGPSGCGKTTTLRIIAGLEESTRGSVLIGERDVARVAPPDRDVALVAQNFALYPHMTVNANLAFGLRMRRRSEGVSSREIDARVREAAEVLRLTPLLGRRPSQLSGGERQRVAIGRAMVRRPSVFLFDEPLAGLDPPLRVELYEVVAAVRERVTAPIVYVTHDQAEAMRLGDRIVVMNRGRSQQIGPPGDVYDRPANRFVGEFIGNPPMNFLDGRLVCSDGTPWFESDGLRLALPVPQARSLDGHVGREVTVGVRPEHVRCRADRRAAPHWPTVTGRVTKRQRFGHETIVHVQIGQQSLLCRVDDETRAERGEMLELAFDMNRIQVFDKGSGANLTQAAGNGLPGG